MRSSSKNADEVVPSARAGEEIVWGTIRSDAAADGPVFVAATVLERGEVVAEKRKHSVPFRLELADGSDLRVEMDLGARVLPITRKRGVWSELRESPLACPFPDFVPGPEVELEIEGACLTNGERVAVLGEPHVSGSEPRGYRDATVGNRPDTIRATIVASGPDAAQLVERSRPKVPGPPVPPSDFWYRRGFRVALVFAAIALPFLLLESDRIVAYAGHWTSVWCALAIYHYRASRTLTRFHPVMPWTSAERKLPWGLRVTEAARPPIVPFYVLVLVLLLLSAFVAAFASSPTAILACIDVAVVIGGLGLIRRLDGAAARTLRILQRDPAQSDDGSWGTIVGTLVSEQPLHREVWFYRWRELVGSHEGRPEYVTQTGAKRTERVPPEVIVATANGPVRLRGADRALWGTAAPREMRFSRKSFARLDEQIAADDPVVVYGRLQAAPDGGREISHTGPGSLILFGASRGADVRDEIRKLILGYRLTMALLLAALAPMVLATVLVTG